MLYVALECPDSRCLPFSDVKASTISLLGNHSSFRTLVLLKFYLGYLCCDSHGVTTCLERSERYLATRS